MNKKKVEEAIRKIRPELEDIGIDLELMDVKKEGIVQVKVRGDGLELSDSGKGCQMKRRSSPGCAGCSLQRDGVVFLIEDLLSENLSGLKKVETV